MFAANRARVVLAAIGAAAFLTLAACADKEIDPPAELVDIVPKRVGDHVMSRAVHTPAALYDSRLDLRCFLKGACFAADCRTLVKTREHEWVVGIERSATDAKRFGDTGVSRCNFPRLHLSDRQIVQGGCDLQLVPTDLLAMDRESFTKKLLSLGQVSLSLLQQAQLGQGCRDIDVVRPEHSATRSQHTLQDAVCFVVLRCCVEYLPQVLKPVEHLWVVVSMQPSR